MHLYALYFLNINYAIIKVNIVVKKITMTLKNTSKHRKRKNLKQHIFLLQKKNKLLNIKLQV